MVRPLVCSERVERSSDRVASIGPPGAGSVGELRGLRGRLLALVLLASLPAVLLALVSAYQQRSHAADTAYDTALRLARQVALGEERQIERASDLLAGLGQQPNLIELAPSICSRALTTLHARYPN